MKGKTSSIISCCIAISYVLASTAHAATSQTKPENVNNNNNKRPKTTSTRNYKTTADQAPLDDILKDTFGLLDVLDQKLTSISNRTASAMMKDNLRALDGSEMDEDASLVKVASEFSADRRSDSGEQLTSDASSEEAVKVEKRAKHLSTSCDDAYLETDPTDRHIRFTLDLMKSIFQSQSYKADTNTMESFLISPLSIQTVLMMMHMGARGQTRREIGNCLHLGTSGDRDRLLSEFISPQAESGTSTSGAATSAKLKRHQHQPAEASVNNKGQQVKRQSVSSMGAHEAFASGVRNLLKDPIVMKAITSANQIIVQKSLPLSSQFEWAIRQYYNGEVKQVDFQNQQQSSTSPADGSSNLTLSSSSSSAESASSTGAKDVQQMVNEWVERQSKGRIVNLLTSPVSTSTLLMAINVLFYKGDWQYKFDPADTETDAWFTQANGKLVKVPMMVNRLPLAFAYDPVMKTSVIELPYKAQRLGLFLLLPDDVAGIYHTMQMLNSSSFANLISSMRRPAPSSEMASNGINVRIPKFNIESSPKLSHILSQYLGLKTLFTPDMADLSGIFSLKKSQDAATGPRTKPATNETTPADAGSIQVGLDELLHKAILQVDEQGSVAAASSAAIVERVGLFNSNYFEADHPFLLFLMDKQTGLVLFSGAFAGDKGVGSSKAPSSSPTSSQAANSTGQAISSTAAPTNGSDGQQRRPKHRRR